MKNQIIIGIGKGRDGTTSLSENLKKIIELNNHQGQVYHEKFVKEIYNNFHFNFDNKKKLEKKNIDIFKKFKLGNIYVGNGYILILDLLKKKYGNKLKIIQLFREKKSWSKSFVKNIKFYPKKHGNYIDDSKSEIFRMCAYHYGELTFNEWNKLSLKKKLEWYYIKNNDLLKKISFSKKNKLILSNTQLDMTRYILKITKFLNSKWKSPKNSLKVNVSKIDYSLLENLDKKIVGTFYSNFDYLQAAKDPTYGALFFLEKVNCHPEY